MQERNKEGRIGGFKVEGCWVACSVDETVASDDGRRRNGENVKAPEDKVAHYVWIRSFEELSGGTYLMFVDLLNMSRVLLLSLSCLVFALMKRPEI